MINLLPPSKKNDLRKEYSKRVLVIWMGASLALIVLLFIALVPSYILAQYKNKAALASSTQTSNVSALEEQQKDLELQIADVKKALNVLKDESSVLLPTDIITLIETHRNNDITISSLLYGATSDVKEPVHIIVKGVAKNRQSLLSLTQGIKGEKRIQKVDLPVSNFAQESNIEFTFDVYGI